MIHERSIERGYWIETVKKSKFLVRLHGEYNASLALWKHHVNLLDGFG